LISPSKPHFAGVPFWTVRGKPLPLPAVKLRRMIANAGRTKQEKNVLVIQR
jgi:hypothetical protein